MTNFRASNSGTKPKTQRTLRTVAAKTESGFSWREQIPFLALSLRLGMTARYIFMLARNSGGFLALKVCSKP
jgi:hypothetical protein